MRVYHHYEGISEPVEERMTKGEELMFSAERTTVFLLDILAKRSLNFLFLYDIHPFSIIPPAIPSKRNAWGEKVELSD